MLQKAEAMFLHLEIVFLHRKYYRFEISIYFLHYYILQYQIVKFDLSDL
jgi:hypothetical protein